MGGVEQVASGIVGGASAEKPFWPHIFLQLLSHGEIVEHKSVKSRGLPIHDQETIGVNIDRSDIHGEKSRGTFLGRGIPEYLYQVEHQDRIRCVSCEYINWDVNTHRD